MALLSRTTLLAAQVCIILKLKDVHGCTHLWVPVWSFDQWQDVFQKVLCNGIEFARNVDDGAVVKVPHQHVSVHGRRHENNFDVSSASNQLLHRGQQQVRIHLSLVNFVNYDVRYT